MAASNANAAINDNDEVKVDLTRQDIDIRILIDASDAGSLIGKNGTVIQKFRQESSSQITITNTEVKRIITVKGVADKVGIALRKIAQHYSQAERAERQETIVKRASSSDTSPPIDETKIELLVQRYQFGAIVGKGGARVKETREKTHSSIRISNAPLEGSQEHVVTVRGTVSSVQQTLMIFLNQLVQAEMRMNAHFPSKLAPIAPKTASSSASAAASASSSAPAYRPQPEALYQPQPRRNHTTEPADRTLTRKHSNSVDDNTQVNDVVIPISESIIGKIIGREGRCINDIRRTSGATITIPEPTGESGERIVDVNISGSIQSMTKAVQMIGAKISEIQKYEQQRQQQPSVSSSSAPIHSAPARTQPGSSANKKN